MPTLQGALFAEASGDAFLSLLTIDHEALLVPIRVVNDNVSIMSNGDTYLAFPFDVTLPIDDAKQMPNAKLSIDNVDRTIIDAARSITSPADVTIQIIKSSDPDTVELSLTDFKLRDVKADAGVVEGVLTLEDFLQEPYPAGTFDPGRFPGGF